MNSLDPIGEDIAALLLRFAPQKLLDDLELSEDTINEFVSLFDEAGYYENSFLIAYSMYYAHKKRRNPFKGYSAFTRFCISPKVIHELIQIAELDGYSEGESIFKEIRSGDARKNAKKAHLEDYSLKKDVITYYENNVDFFKKANGKPEGAEFVARYMIDNKIVPVKHRTIADWIRGYRKAKENNI